MSKRSRVAWFIGAAVFVGGVLFYNGLPLLWVIGGAAVAGGGAALNWD